VPDRAWPDHVRAPVGVRGGIEAGSRSVQVALEGSFESPSRRAGGEGGAFARGETEILDRARSRAISLRPGAARSNDLGSADGEAWESEVQHLTPVLPMTW
jgi:hypothetical protein